MPKVSIIMPSLNVAEYIRPCIESVLGQTLTDIEILAVDAGSTDGTLEILNEIAKNDKRVRIIYSDKKSYGYQMNLGIKEAIGDYVGVVETDDIIEADMYEFLYNIAVENKANYAKGMTVTFFKVSETLRVNYPIEVFEKSRYADSNHILEVAPNSMPELILRDYYLWTGLYERNFIKKLRFNETAGAAYQDIGFLLQSFLNAEKAIYTDKLVYHYRKDNLNASGYNTRAFQYLVKENAYVDELLAGRDIAWHKASICKLFRQTNVRFSTMATLGKFWEDALPDIEIISEKLQAADKAGMIEEKDFMPGEWKCLKLLTENPYLLYDHYKKNFIEKRENILQISRLLEAKEAVIFGSGRIGKFLHALIQYKSLGTVLCYCDNQTTLWETEIQGLKVLSPQKAVEQYPDALYLIAGRRDEKQMRKQLEALNIDDSKLYTYIAGGDIMLFQTQC